MESTQAKQLIQLYDNQLAQKTRDTLSQKILRIYISDYENKKSIKYAALDLRENINYEQFIKNFNISYYQPEYLNIINSLTEKIIYSALQFNNPYIIRHERIIIWLRDIKLLSSGTYGQVAKTGILGNDSIFALKTPLKDYTDMEHEYGVGLILNRLREKEILPNIEYTYSAFNCGDMIIGNSSSTSESKIKAWCHYSVDNPINYKYILLENIPNSKNLGKHIVDNDLNINQMISILLQIFFTIWIANVETNFTHWDLHLGNILLRKVRANTAIRYSINNEIYMVATYGYIATIIDYGFATINIPNTNVLIQPKVKSKRHKGYSNPMQDIYTAYLDFYFYLMDKSEKSIYPIRDVLLYLISDLIHPYSPDLVKFILGINVTDTDFFEVSRSLIFKDIPKINIPMNDIFNYIVKEFQNLVNINEIILDKPHQKYKIIIRCENRKTPCKTMPEILDKVKYKENKHNIEDVCLHKLIVHGEKDNEILYENIETLMIKSLEIVILNTDIIEEEYNKLETHFNTLDIDIIQGSMEKLLEALIQSWVEYSELAYISRLVECSNTLEKYKTIYRKKFDNIIKEYEDITFYYSKSTLWFNSINIIINEKLNTPLLKKYLEEILITINIPIIFNKK